MPWIRNIEVQSFRASNGMPYPSFWGSWLAWRLQLTETPGTTPFWGKILPYIHMPNGEDPAEYWNWTTPIIINAFHRALQEKGASTEYPDGVCPQCGGAGRIHVDNTQEGWDMWCLCVLVTKVNEWFRTYWPLSSRPIEPATLRNFEQEEVDNGRPYSTINIAAEYAYRFCVEPETWLGLTGLKGTGKTHLLRVIHTVYGPGVSLFLRMADFVNTVFSLYQKNDGSLEDWIIKVKNAPLLLLDDIGTGYMKIKDSPSEGGRMGFAMAKLHDVIDYRWANRKEFPLAYTSNESQQSFRSDAWGILGDRLSDEANWIVGMVGSSYRQSHRRKEERPL